MSKRLIHCTLLLMTALCLASMAHGQTQSDKNAADAGRPNLSYLFAQAWPTRRTPFSLMYSSGRNTSAPNSNITPMAVGPNLQVLGGGTVGRLTKWTGFTSSNSFIGDSNIIEDKFGNVSIGTGSSTVTIAGTLQASGGVTVMHDATLQGNGTSGLPLGVAIPLILNGAGGFSGVIQATNTTAGGDGVRAFGGSSSSSGFGGDGVFAVGGFSSSGSGGDGVDAFGGSSSSFGGLGVRAFGGDSSSGFGGDGVAAAGGNSSSGGGGEGVVAQGGVGSGMGHKGGIGIEAFAGSGVSGATPGLAGKFHGDVEVTGTLSKGGGSFKIDHPLDPENKYLYHSFVESPDMKNIYDGNVVTDENGEATVQLPDWFEALNRDFRYQLTVIGTFAQAIVAEEIKGNRFTIRTSAPGVKVSWQVTGIRHDAFANKHRIAVEEDKPEKERGYYLHPDVFNQPEERGIEWVEHPERMQQLKQRRLEAEQKLKQQQR